MSIETMTCPKCRKDCGFEPSTGVVWCPACGYQYAPSYEEKGGGGNTGLPAYTRTVTPKPRPAPPEVKAEFARLEAQTGHRPRFVVQAPTAADRRRFDR